MVTEDKAGILDRDARINLNVYWGTRLFEYDGSDIVYICCHEDVDALTSDVYWYIWKITYSGSNVTAMEGPLKGAHDDRATLGWR